MCIPQKIPEGKSGVSLNKTAKTDICSKRNIVKLGIRRRQGAESFGSFVSFLLTWHGLEKKRP